MIHSSSRRSPDIVDSYLSPPSNALVLCVVEKSQCQALERTQPLLPKDLGYVEGVTHDYRADSRQGSDRLITAYGNRLRVATLIQQPRTCRLRPLALLSSLGRIWAYQSLAEVSGGGKIWLVFVCRLILSDLR